MDNHKMACFLLVALIAAMLFGTQKMHQRTVAAENAANEVRNSAEQAQRERQMAEISLKNIDSKTADLRVRYAEWLPHFEAVRNQQAGEQRISEIVREGDIFLLSQKYEEREIDKEALISHALVATLVVEDDYNKTMNWLGKLEESIPACRISKAKMVRGDRGNDIRMEVTVQVPVLKG